MENRIQMTAINHRRISFTASLAGLFLLITASTTQAAFVFTGQSIDVSYEDSLGTFTDSIIAGNSNPDISYNDGSNIGGEYGLTPGPDVPGIMLDSEVIDFADTSVTFNLRGDGPAHATSGYQTTGLDGSYIITLTSADFSIGSVSIGSMTDMIGVGLGTEVTFDGKNIFFDISTLGILEVTPGADIGSITLNVEFVPVPAALPLMLSGLAGLVLASRRRIFK
jgi:hypothetical protein